MSRAARPAPGVATLYVKGGPGGDVRGDCPFSMKAALALHLRKVEFVEQWIDFSDKPGWYEEYAPDRSTPCFVARDGEVVTSSDEICALADEEGEKGGVRLYREDNERWDKAAEVIRPVFGCFARLMKSGSEGEGEGELRRDLMEALEAVEKHLALCEGPFLLGNEASVMDCNFGPKLAHMVVAGGKYKNVDLKQDEFPMLRRFSEAMMALEEWDKSICDDDTIIWGWSKFF